MGLDKCAVGDHYEFPVQVAQDPLSVVVETLRASMDVSRTQYMWMEIVNLVSCVFILLGLQTETLVLKNSFLQKY